jgi:hypothetical protein
VEAEPEPEPGAAADEEEEPAAEELPKRASIMGSWMFVKASDIAL